jgi:hypothetical protein
MGPYIQRCVFFRGVLLEGRMVAYTHTHARTHTLFVRFVTSMKRKGNARKHNGSYRTVHFYC